MLRQVGLLTKVQLCNLFGFNEFRHTKDPKKKGRYIGMAAIWIYLIVMLVAYIAALCFGLSSIGMATIIPVYLCTICSLIILFFSFFKAGSIIFQKKNYDTLISMPVSQSSIVLSRYFGMYITNLLISALVMVTGMICYSLYAPTNFMFWLTGLLGSLFIPMLPMTLATAIGAGITAISSRMKHKSMVSSVLTFLFVLAVFGSSYLLGDNAEVIMSETMLDSMTDAIHNVYPPAGWLGSSMLDGNLLMLLLYIVASILALAITVAIVQRWFQPICSALNATTAKNNFSAKQLAEATSGKQNSVVTSMVKRELKRYFASSIYVTNTLMGYVLMAVAGIALLVAGKNFLPQLGELEAVIDSVIPYFFGAMASMAPMTACSISMEGKQWWIAKTIPVRNKDIFDSKLLANLVLAFPGYLIAVICTILALRPDITGCIWMVIIPAVYIVFSGVLGISINLAVPIFNWENEVRVVKQSASVGFTILVGMITSVAPAVLFFVSSEIPQNLVCSGTVLVLLIATIILYTKNNKKDLRSIG